MESFLWRNDPSQSISDLDWFIRRPEQFSNCSSRSKSLWTDRISLTKTVVSSAYWVIFIEWFVDLYGGWDKRGFGPLTGEVWLGLDKIHRLTGNESYKFCVDLQDFAGNTGYAEYDLFKIASEGEKYKLRVGSYSGLISHHFGFQIFYVCY